MNILFNDSWKFLKTDVDFSLEEAEKAASGFFDSEKVFREVEIPHDWLIWDTNNLYETGIGWYVKDFEIDDLPAHSFFRFDGVYMDTEVYINGKAAFQWKYGYSTFTFEATEYLKNGINRILVRVNHISPNTRWYSGAGIYRDVHFITKNDAYLVCDGTYVHSTELPDGDFKMHIETEVFTGDTDCVPVYSLWKDGAFISNFGAGINIGNAKDVYTERQKKNIEKTGESGLDFFSLPDFSEYGDIKLFSTDVVVQSPIKWDIENPQLYSLHVTLMPAKRLSDDDRIDSEHIKIGFKTVVFDSEKGLFLNGRNLKIHGVCEHHDLGLLGAAFDIDAMKRKLVILQKMGVNSIRTSHNMPDPKLFDLCDEMGLLVNCEAFDMWEMPKTKYDYARFFPTWSYKDVASWVRRDRNRASIFMWSIGNEIPDTVNGEHGVPITRHLTTQVLNYDPYMNAHVTIGSNFMPWEGGQKCAEVVQLAGYNYTEKLYEEHHKIHPDYVIYGSETSSIVSSRGVYHFPASQLTMSDDDEQCSSLGNSAVSWGAKSIEALVYVDRDIPFSMGQYLWTGTDYIGEPTPYQTKNSYFGQVDTAGFPKDDYYCLMAEWTCLEDNPFVHVYPYWSWNEGQLIDVRACTTGDSVELFLNGKSLGKKYIDHNKGKTLFPIWQVPYEKGELKAVAYDLRGNVIAKHIRHSFSDARYPVLVAEGRNFRVAHKKADGTPCSRITIYPEKENEIVFVDISACDEEGYTVENAMDYMEIHVDGGILLGMDNGDSTDYDSYKINVRKMFNGKLLAMVRANGLNEIIVEAVLTKGKDNRIPVREVKITTDKPLSFKPGNEQIKVKAQILPANATDKDIKLLAVNESNIEVDYLEISDVQNDDGVISAVITAIGDGRGYIRAVSKSGTDKIKIISCIEYNSEGFGYHFTNPYKYVSCGLYSRLIGDVGAGNDKGISTEENARSGAVYKNIDFGAFGSDEMTIDLFTFSNDVYHVDMYIGEPDNGGELLTTLDYSKPCVWNLYQPETYKLPKRLKGLKTITFMANCKLHIKGFEFKLQEKAYSKIYAADYDSILGDSYTVGEKAVTDIGNNVVLSFNDMDFGEKGSNRLIIYGKTELDSLTIRLRFAGEDFENVQNFAISGNTDMNEIELSRLCGKGTVEFIFLPGTKFDFEALEFKA